MALGREVGGAVLDPLVELRVQAADLVFGQLAAMDVAAEADEPDDLAAPVAHRQLRRQVPACLAGCRVGPELLAILERNALQHRLVVATELGRHLGRVEIGVGPADELARRVCAHHARDGHIGQDEPAGGILRVDVVGHQVDERAHQRTLIGDGAAASASARAQEQPHGQRAGDRADRDAAEHDPDNTGGMHSGRLFDEDP